MLIPEFVVGVVSTLLAELGILVVALCISTYKNKNNRR